MEGRIRAICLGFQERLGCKVDARERVVAFMPEYGSYLMDRLKQGKDGRVAYERFKGKKPSVAGVEFGGKLLCKVAIRRKSEKSQCLVGTWDLRWDKKKKWREHDLHSARHCFDEGGEHNTRGGEIGKGLRGLGEVGPAEMGRRSRRRRGSS